MKLKYILEKNTEQVYALMRIVTGILFFSHGFQKISGMLQGVFPTDNTLILLAALIEFIGGLGIIFGWKVFIFAFIASGEMAVAYFKSHQPRGVWPIDNGGEKAVFYCFLFLFMAAKGSGKWSLDNYLKKGQRFQVYQ